MSRWFNIFGGVRQGCVLSPRLFCAVLQAALAIWRQSVESLGLDFGDGLPALLDLRFADDLLLFAKSARDAAVLLDELVRCCSLVGLCLNATKTKVLTTEAQAPSRLLTLSGHVVDILSPDDSHKWLGCMLSCRLPRGRWIKRALEWRPMGRFAPGRPRTTWTTCLEKIARFKRWCDWATAASQGQMWYQARDEFCRFVMGQ